MKKKHFHAEVVFKDGKYICGECGAEVDEYLTSETPCTVKTTALTIVEELPLFISVYNCQANLAAQIRDTQGGFRVAILEPSDDSIIDEFYQALEDDVYDQGGALNISGWYSLTEQTAEKVARWLEEGKLRVS